MLPGARFRDDPLLAHPDGEQGLADGIVELVRAGVAEVFALEVDVRAAEVLAQSRGGVQRRRAADESVAVSRKLELELRVRFGLVPFLLELIQGAHQRLRHVLAAVSAKAPADRMRELV